MSLGRGSWSGEVGNEIGGSGEGCVGVQERRANENGVAEMLAEGYGGTVGSAEISRFRELSKGLKLERNWVKN